MTSNTTSQPASEYDFLIIGAGCSGISAARTLQPHGSCLILEARQRVGGRAYTHPMGVDLGATWLHDAENNPLTEIAKEMGIELIDSDKNRNRLAFVGDTLANEEQVKEYRYTWDRFEERVERAAQEYREKGQAVAASVVEGDSPWDPTVSSFEGDVIAAWTLSEIDLFDFDATLLGGKNLVPVCGLGNLVEMIGRNLPVKLGAVVDSIAYSDSGVQVSGNVGSIKAKAVIVTVPTAVLASDAITFTPALPAQLSQSFKDLHLGAVVRVLFHCTTHGETFGHPPYTSMVRQIGKGETAIPVSCWFGGKPFVTTWIGGPLAVELEKQGRTACVERAWKQVESFLGPDARKHFDLDNAIVTDWMSDPFSLGAYSHCAVGAADARKRYQQRAGRVWFAGEAGHATLAATVAGAWIDGERAAREVLKELGF